MKVVMSAFVTVIVAFASVGHAKEPTMLSCTIDKELVGDAGGRRKAIPLKEPFNVHFAELGTKSPKVKSDGTFGMLSGEPKLIAISESGGPDLLSRWYAVDASQAGATVIQLFKEGTKRSAHLHRLTSHVSSAADYQDKIVFGDCK